MDRKGELQSKQYCVFLGPLHFEKCTNTPLKIDAVHKILEMMDEFTLAFALIHQKENI